ncbi:hypothetical protein SKAU_G00097390 [Synaphobranchus kaupii]|uniref:Uncharacterized protein n=1 Tax=Synaphobranchus kaupii TaxID=118154 RepID=A0A9Q1FYV3_SYNKA|nr:hypothetical protein SKAU_G00097390 [Synaphobranchus kaupii]
MVTVTEHQPGLQDPGKDAGGNQRRATESDCGEEGGAPAESEPQPAASERPPEGWWRPANGATGGLKSGRRRRAPARYNPAEKGDEEDEETFLAPLQVLPQPGRQQPLTK